MRKFTDTEILARKFAAQILNNPNSTEQERRRAHNTMEQTNEAAIAREIARAGKQDASPDKPARQPANGLQHLMSPDEKRRSPESPECRNARERFLSFARAHVDEVERTGVCLRGCCPGKAA